MSITPAADKLAEITNTGSSGISIERQDYQRQYLKFHMLADMTALCPVSNIVELINLSPSQIVPIPHLPEPVCGVHNWRGEILWMLDLGCLITGQSLHSQNIRTYSTVIINNQWEDSAAPAAESGLATVQNLGLIVQSVSDMEWCNPDLIQSPPAATIDHQILKFSQGYWINSSGDMQMVLDIRSLFAELPHAAI